MYYIIVYSQNFHRHVSWMVFVKLTPHSRLPTNAICQLFYTLPVCLFSLVLAVENGSGLF